MPEAHTSKNIICPYFKLGNNGDCQMTQGGLYIPLPAHIEIFCTTAKYFSCPQYTRGKALIHENHLHNVEITDSRRRFPRIRNRLPLILSTCDEKGRPVEILDRDAMTLDFSLGGLRISSNTEIPSDKILHFSFREDLHHNSITGVGEVRWCRQTEGSRFFEAGLAFLDKTLPPTVSDRLGLH